MSEETTKHLPDGELKQILTRLDSIGMRLDSMDTRLDSIDTRLTTLEDRVDRWLQETRPIWEQVLTKLGNLENDMRTGFRRLERQMGLLAEDVLVVRADQRDLEKRVDKLESEPTQ